MPQNTTPGHNEPDGHTGGAPGEVSEAQVMEALSHVDDPEIGLSIVELGMVRDLHIDNGKVSFVLALTVPGCPLAEFMSKNARDAVKAVPGVTDVALTTRGMTDQEREEAFRRIRRT